MTPPRLLLVPNLSELEWSIRPQLEQWAEVASYDAPGVNDEPVAEDFSSKAVGMRGLEELERRGWDRCVIVADEFGVVAAAELARAAPEKVQAMALGHARLSNAIEGDRAPLNEPVFAACMSLIQSDPRTFVRQLFQLTGGEARQGGFGEEVIDVFRERIPDDLLLASWECRPAEGADMRDVLGAIDVPLLLARHEGCLVYTHEGFEDAVAAFPRATTLSCIDKPSNSQLFADALEAFCKDQTAAAG